MSPIFRQDRLYSQLLNTGLQTKDNPLYQVIYQLINAVDSLSKNVISSSSSSGPAGTAGEQGIPGLHGFDGLDGNDSLIPGQVGPKGSKGDIGIPGLDGESNINNEVVFPYLNHIEGRDINLKSLGIYNYILNGNFDSWSGGVSAAADRWLLFDTAGSVAREATIVKGTTYSCKIVSATSGTYDARQQANAGYTGGLGLPASYFQGRTLTVGAWVYATVAGVVNLHLRNFNGVTANDAQIYHSGSGTWEFLTATRQILDDATTVHVGLRVDSSGGAANTGYFDGVFLVDGSYVSGYSPNPLDNLTMPSGLITTDVNNQRVGIYTPADSVALLKLRAGETSFVPFRFTSGSLKIVAVAGGEEFLNDDFFATITTGAARKAFVLDDGARLTSGIIPKATTNGRLIDGITFASGTWTPTDGSGAALSFTNPYGTYYRLGDLVFITFGLQYPVTASGATAKINGLPFTSYATATQQLRGTISGKFPNGGFWIPASVTYVQPLDISTQTSYTNANLSGATMMGMGIYQITP